MQTMAKHECGHEWCTEQFMPDEHVGDPATLAVTGGQIECRAWISDADRREDEITFFVERVTGEAVEVHLTPSQARQLRENLGTAIADLATTR